MRRLITLMVVLATVAIAWPAATSASVPLSSFCTIYGQREHTLVGLGLVVGLKGTGDGGKNLPTIRALAQTLRLLDNPTATEADLKDANNVALVIVQARVPSRGGMYGQNIDCTVSSISASSLRGGQLLLTPLGGEMMTDGSLKAIASGELEVSDPQVQTAATIRMGVTLMQNFNDPFIENNKVRILINPTHASMDTATNVAETINQFITRSQQTYSRSFADAIGPNVVEVMIPESYRTKPTVFIADIMRRPIDQPNKDARVIVNSRTGVIVVTGEVEIDAVAISHKSLTVDIATSPNGVSTPRTPEEAKGVGFIPVVDSQSGANRQKLQMLIESLNQLRVPSTDVIEIIKSIDKSGKLHAELIIE